MPLPALQKMHTPKFFDRSSVGVFEITARVARLSTTMAMQRVLAGIRARFVFSTADSVVGKRPQPDSSTNGGRVRLEGYLADCVAYANLRVRCVLFVR